MIYVQSNSLLKFVIYHLLRMLYHIDNKHTVLSYGVEFIIIYCYNLLTNNKLSKNESQLCVFFYVPSAYNTFSKFFKK